MAPCTLMAGLIGVGFGSLRSAYINLKILQCPVSSNITGAVLWKILLHEGDLILPYYVDSLVILCIERTFLCFYNLIGD